MKLQRVEESATAGRRWKTLPSDIWLHIGSFVGFWHLSASGTRSVCRGFLDDARIWRTLWVPPCTQNSKVQKLLQSSQHALLIRHMRLPINKWQFDAIASILSLLSVGKSLQTLEFDGLMRSSRENFNSLVDFVSKCPKLTALTVDIMDDENQTFEQYAQELKPEVQQRLGVMRWNKDSRFVFNHNDRLEVKRMCRSCDLELISKSDGSDNYCSVCQRALCDACAQWSATCANCDDRVCGFCFHQWVPCEFGRKRLHKCDYRNSHSSIFDLHNRLLHEKKRCNRTICAQCISEKSRLGYAEVCAGCREILCKYCWRRDANNFRHCDPRSVVDSRRPWPEGWHEYIDDLGGWVCEDCFQVFCSECASNHLHI